MPIAEIAEKLRDAMSMFWQSLNEEERRIVLFYAAYLGAAYLGAACYSTVAARRREQARAELVEAVVERFQVQAHGR